MKAIIYNRTSTTEQHPELQLEECRNYCKNKGWEIIDELEEQESAFKDESKRKVFLAMIERAKNKEFEHIVVWNMDRFSRQPEEDVLGLTKILSMMYSVQIHAVHGDVWSEMIESMGKIKEMGFIGEAIAEFLEKLIKGLEFQRAHRESVTKSERVKMAVKREDGVTKSYKGNAWGFHSVGEEADKRILELSKQGKSYRQICSEVFYWNKHRNKKFVSIGYVSKLINVHKLKNQLNEKEANRLDATS